jgi:hypothetical protein
MANSVNSLRNLNVHSIAIQVPKFVLARDGNAPTDVSSANSVIGVWTTASRQRAQIASAGGVGPWVQISRLGNPLINEVVVPLSKKDQWNRTTPDQDSQYAESGLHPELAKLLPVLYPTAFPNLAKLTAPRADLAAILFTGLPSGVVPGFQNFTGKTIADMLRLNMAVPPADNPNILGIIGGDLAGFPNGRRVQDDVTTVELRAVAGATYPLIDKTYKPDDAATAVGTFLDGKDNKYLTSFPYLGVPYDGYGTGALARVA